jgi:hypothetical protein
MSRFKAWIPVDKAGYEWRDSKSEPTLVGRSRGEWIAAVKQGRRGDDVVGKSYDPFVKEPALFKIFAALDPTPKAIVGFANEFGELATLAEVLSKSANRWNTLTAWLKAIESMRHRLAIADAYLANKERHAKAALKIVRDCIEPMELAPIAELGPNGSISVAHVTDSLLDVCYLQLAESILDQKQFRNCELCRRAFEVSPEQNRSDRTFCSDTCRVKSYQRRKKRAIELREAGRTLRDIVSVVGSDMETIKRWIKPKGE